MKSDNTDVSTTLIKVTAGIASLIGMIALLALLSEGTRADTNGFNPGARPFQNPYANTPQQGQPPGGGSFFDDDSDDDFASFPPPEGNVVPAQPGGSPFGGGFDDENERPAPSGGSTGGKGASNNKGGGNSVSMGGSPANGGVVSNKKVAPIQLDVETGEGGRELVTDFNFPDADILDIAKTLGKLTGKNFILDKDVKGRISIISNSPITVSDAWKAFLTALDMNQLALIPSGKYIRIARSRDARDKQLKTYTGDFSPDTDALITRVFPLKYIDADEVARTFRSFMPANSRIIPYEQTNTVIVTDTGSNIAKLTKMLEILDVEGYDVGIEVVPVKWASASELSKLIDTLIPGTGGSPTGGAQAPRFGGGSSRFNARRTKEGGVINAIIADERTNTLIVNANTKGVEQVRSLVATLDQKQPATVGGGKVHVVYLQFAEAEAMATTLNNLSQGASSAFRPMSPLAGGTGVNPVSQSLFEGTIKVSADKTTNSLVINASPSDFVTLQRVILKLDIPRDEVFVEVIIMEVTLNKTLDFSANVASPVSGLFMNNNSDLATFITNPASLNGTLVGFKAGNTNTIQVGTQQYQISNVMGLIRAIQTTSKANVLATPQIIALDNSEATFDSTQKVPVPSSTSVQGAGVTNSITKENVSLSIKIKPQINKISNFVKLDVTTKIADLQTQGVPRALQDQAFATLERTAQTTVVVGDSDTVVIGGLIRDKIQETVNKVPLLGDIPILGWLFSSRTNQIDKTNLLMFMTPHITRQYEKVRAILDRKLKERDDFIEKNVGGDDPMRDGRDEIIRHLPDIKELAKQKPQQTATVDEEPAAKEAAPESTTPPPAPSAPSTGTEAPKSGTGN